MAGTRTVSRAVSGTWAVPAKPMERPMQHRVHARTHGRAVGDANRGWRFRRTGGGGHAQEGGARRMLRGGHGGTGRGRRHGGQGHGGRGRRVDGDAVLRQELVQVHVLELEVVAVVGQGAVPQCRPKEGTAKVQHIVVHIFKLVLIYKHSIENNQSLQITIIYSHDV